MDFLRLESQKKHKTKSVTFIKLAVIYYSGKTMVSGRRGGGLPAVDIVSVPPGGRGGASSPASAVPAGSAQHMAPKEALTFWAPRENEHGLGIWLSLFSSLYKPSWAFLEVNWVRDCFREETSISLDLQWAWLEGPAKGPSPDHPECL